MKTPKLTKKLEAALLKQFGSHNKIAEELGISYRRWCKMRKDREISKRVEMIALLKLRRGTP